MSAFRILFREFFRQFTLVAIVVALDIVGGRLADRRSPHAPQEVWNEDQGRIAVLGLAGAIHRDRSMTR